jgi:hypothetical protein
MDGILGKRGFGHVKVVAHFLHWMLLIKIFG